MIQGLFFIEDVASRIVYNSRNYRHRLNSIHDERFYYVCCASILTGCIARINQISKDIRLISKDTCGNLIESEGELSSAKTYTVYKIRIQLMDLWLRPNDRYFIIIIFDRATLFFVPWVFSLFSRKAKRLNLYLFHEIITMLDWL
ncbi:hypothetical protein MXB_2429 [Myxobolus squamalis]|nr:hypothetical protein MXB_2429 [Myxobolus squamalis]